MSNDPMKKSEANDAKEPLQVASSEPDGDGLEAAQPATLPSDPVNEGKEQKPSHDEVAEQICKIEASDEDDDGPNETLKRHIEMYSYYSPVFASVGYTLIGAIFIPAMLYLSLIHI